MNAGEFIRGDDEQLWKKASRQTERRRIINTKEAKPSTKNRQTKERKATTDLGETNPNAQRTEHKSKLEY